MASQGGGVYSIFRPFAESISKYRAQKIGSLSTIKFLSKLCQVKLLLDCSERAKNGIACVAYPWVRSSRSPTREYVPYKAPAMQMPYMLMTVQADQARLLQTDDMLTLIPSIRCSKHKYAAGPKKLRVVQGSYIDPRREAQSRALPGLAE